MKYRSKVVEIEAFRYNVDNRPDWFQDKVSDLTVITHETFCQIKTLEGEMRGQKGDWIIRGTEGELYPCKPSVFARKYELVNDKEPA